MSDTIPSAIVVEIIKAVEPVGVLYDGVPTCALDPEQPAFMQALTDAVRPILGAKTIKGVFEVERELLDWRDAVHLDDDCPLERATFCLANALDQFIATAEAQTIEDVEARLECFTVGEAEEWLSDCLWNPMMENLARDLRRIKAGELGRDVAGATFAEFQYKHLH